MPRPRLRLAPVSGALALALAAGILVTEVAHGGSSSTTASLVLAALGGGLAIWQYERVGPLVAADALLAGAALVSIFGLGALFVLPLLPLLMATAVTPAQRQDVERRAGPGFDRGFVGAPVHRPGEVMRKARDAVVRRVVRPAEDEPDSARRSA